VRRPSGGGSGSNISSSNSSPAAAAAAAAPASSSTVMLRALSGDAGGAVPSRDYSRLGFDAAEARLGWGALLARDALDWACVAALFLVGVACDGAEPFHQYLQPEQLWAISYPLQANTVPSWAVLPIAFLIPSAVFGGMHAAKRLDRRDTVRAVQRSACARAHGAALRRARAAAAARGARVRALTRLGPGRRSRRVQN
jgi:hypothetical protein